MLFLTSSERLVDAAVASEAFRLIVPRANEDKLVGLSVKTIRFAETNSAIDGKVGRNKVEIAIEESW